MADQDLRIGVIGLGAIGPSHIFAIDQTEGCEVTAVCDVRADAAAEAGKKHGVPHFTSTGAMLEADLVDAVTLCTPSGYHLEAALQAIEAGKHILIEKPLEITTERVDRIAKAAADRGVKLAGVYQSRFCPVVRRVKQLVDGGLLGEIYSGSAYTKYYRTQEYYDSGGWRGTWKLDGGGCLMNQGIHLLDLYVWFMGDAEEVMARTETKGRNNVEVETLALAVVKFASGASGVLEGTTLAYPGLGTRLEIFGSRGTVALTKGKVLRMDLVDPTPEEAAARDELEEQRKQLEERQAKAPKKKVAPGTAVPNVDMGHAPIVEDFVDAIRNDRNPFVTGEDARCAVALISAVYESGRHNGKPTALP